MKNFIEVDTTLDEKHSVKISESLSLSWAAFRQEAWAYIGFCFVSFIILFVSALIPFASYILTPFFSLGFATFFYEQRVNSRGEFNDFFKSFQKFGNVFLTYLLKVAAYIVACIPVLIFGGIAFFQDLQEAQSDPMSYHPVFTGALIIAILTTLLLCLLVATLTYFATYFAYFYAVTPVEAIKLSFKMGIKNFGHLIMLFIFSAFIAVIGWLACCVGLLATIPLSSMLLYLSFSGITKLGDDNDPEFDFEENRSTI